MKTAGIYRITSPSGGCYVGSSIAILRRFGTHKSELRRGVHHAHALQSAVNKYGLNAMRFDPIFSVFDSSDLIEFEQKFMDELKPSYNSSKFAEATSRDPVVAGKISNSAKSSIRHKHARLLNQKKATESISRPVVRLTDGVVFKSGYEAARSHAAPTPDNIFTAISSGTKFSGHYWKYEGSPILLEQVEANALERQKAGALRSKATMIAARQKGVIRISDGQVFTSIAGAARAIGCNHSAIQRALREGTNCKGSGWSYV